MTSESENILGFSSGDSKLDEPPNKEEEFYYRMRFNSLKMVLEAMQTELETYKNRCLGVDTIVLALKESKKENDKLCKHIKATDQQISVLQKRLAKHGLPDSVNVQDSELFVPGASKQTLDNLAKENARLRSLLKQEGGHTGKKSTDECDDIKAALEEATCEIEELRSKLKSQEEMKLDMVRDYEYEIRKLANEKEQILKHEEEQRTVSTGPSSKSKPQDCDGAENGLGSQTQFSDNNTAQELKSLLLQTVEKCSQLEAKLSYDIQKEAASDRPSNENSEVPAVSQEMYDQLDKKFQEAISMNQKWQVYSKDREAKIQAMTDRIHDLEDPNQMAAQMTQELNRKDAELMEFHKQIQLLSREVTELRNWRSHAQQETGTVEILKQQIQVCTEDFNTERKDREQAVQKAKGLEEECERLRIEMTKLRTSSEKYKRVAEQSMQRNSPPTEVMSMTSSYNSNLQSPAPPSYGSLYNPSSLARYPSQVPVQESHFHPAESLGPQPLAIPFSDYQHPANTATSESIHRIPTNPGRNNYSSMPRPAIYPRPVSGSPSDNLSMPPLAQRGSSVKEEMVCPTCTNKFAEDVLVTHIGSCTSKLK